ncbi:hypothetical protein QBC47DRAFT_414936 [Echria macrotheca]|uniref:Nephrocystin 3-like N-terminal domain-containing protein n=1 Tax=Echria macrotheca TaxID=438768 RepID=A0AAJ0F518_9PEZI|nr:hypothetical protein QBC47DRAFT_414936 [Echria macrotheca]
MDPLSLAASVAGLASLTLEVIKLTTSYVDSVKNAPKESLQLAQELSALAKALSDFDQFLKSQNQGAMQFERTSTLVIAATSCRDSLSSLRVTLAKFMDRSEGRKWYRRAMWPLKGQGHSNAIAVLQRFTQIFHFSLTINGCNLLANTADEINDMHKTQTNTADDITEIRALVEGLSSLNLGDWVSQQQQQIAEIHSVQQKTQHLATLEWISTTNPSLSHNLALKKREPDTGTWFLESDEFCNWLHSAGFIWLYGIPTREICLSSNDRVLAYFYFDFQRPEEHGIECLLGCLLRQTSAKEPVIPKPVELLYDKHGKAGHRPSAQELEMALIDVVKGLHKDIYIIIDALDEAPESNGKRGTVLKLLARLATSPCSNLHLLATSRNEIDIRSCIGPLSGNGISIEDSVVDADIRKYVMSSITEDDRMSKLAPGLKDLIVSRLAEGANGMFRWVFCQLDELRTSRRPADIRRTLDTLPKTLDETYERIIRDMTPSDREAAMSILTWMVYSQQTLTLEEAAEAAIIRPGPEPINPDDRLFEPSEVLRICRALILVADEDITCLVESVEDMSGSDESMFEADKFVDIQRLVVRFAHFSVQEYLVSGRSEMFSSWCPSPHGYIADCCISSLCRLELETSADQALADNALIRYAAGNWNKHLSHVEGPLALINKAILLLSNSPSYFHRELGIYRTLRNITRLYSHNAEKTGKDMVSPLVCACYLGIGSVVKQLVQNGADVDGISEGFGAPLHGTAVSGCPEIAELLLEHRASVDVSYATLGTPLRLAAKYSKYEYGHYNDYGHYHDTMKVLLQHGANPNLPSGDHDYGCLFDVLETNHQDYGFLFDISETDRGRRRDKSTHLLLDYGADIREWKERTGSIFMVACEKCGIGVVKRLVEMGVDTDPPASMQYASALDAAVQARKLETIDFLLGLGASKSVNRTGGIWGSPLQSALKLCCHIDVVSRLLDAGADVNLAGPDTDAPLRIAVQNEDIEMVKLLLCRRANANFIGRGRSGTALRLATAGGHVKLVELLLAHGADPNLVFNTRFGQDIYSDMDSDGETEMGYAIGEYFPETALDTAEGWGHSEIVEILLAAGARRASELTGVGAQDTEEQMNNDQHPNEDNKNEREAGVHYAG